MGKVIVIEFVTLDGVVEDPDGSGGTSFGGWAFRFGPESVAGDKFQLGPILDTGVLLLGRRTWELFSRIWPTRTDEFSTTMNRILKIVVTRGEPALDAWSNSSRLDGELVEAVTQVARGRDVVIAGSTSVVRALTAAGAVDEYRLLVFPTVVGTGQRLFDRPIDLRLTAAAPSNAAVLARYERVAAVTTVL